MLHRIDQNRIYFTATTLRVRLWLGKMNQEESDDFAPEYLIPLSGSDGPIPLPSPHPETPQTFRVEEEQPKSSEASKRSRSMSPNYPMRIDPRDKEDDQFNSVPRRVSFPASPPVLSRSRSDSLSQSSHERFEESPRKRLMFDVIVKGVLDSSDRMDPNDKRVSFGTTAQDDTIEPIKIWNMEVPLCLSRYTSANQLFVVVQILHWTHPFSF